MSTLGKRIGLLINLGQVLRDITSVKPELFPEYHDQLKEAIKKAKIDNSWFTEDTILESLRVWGDTLTKTKLTNWLRTYDIPESIPEPKKVQVIMAGNIPLVGFHDMIGTFISGNIFYGKLSSKDKILLPLILEWMLDFEPGFENLLNLPVAPLKQSWKTLSIYSIVFRLICSLTRMSVSPIAFSNSISRWEIWICSLMR